MITLKNELLQAKISLRGAELQSLYNLHEKLEYMWSGDPAHWGKHSPVLFPIVGQLRDNSYHYKGENFSLPRHGFAREMEFTAEQADEKNATFLLKSNDDTRAAYPFDFSLRIHYRLEQQILYIKYEVRNEGSDTMYFSIGAHPAFAVPLIKGSDYTDYYLQFDRPLTAAIWPLQGGLVLPDPTHFLDNERNIPLKYDLFYKDALIFKNLTATSIAIKSDVTPHGVTINYEGFPYLGLWAAPDAPFVCIEPWAGLADSVYHYGDITLKEGINTLDKDGIWERTWSIRCE